MRLFILFLFTGFLATANSSVLPEIRTLYLKAKNDETSCRRIIDIGMPTESQEVVKGYKACATIIMAEHTFNPSKKLSYFNKGKAELDKLVQSNNNNPELRFLRFTIQSNAPSFLGYNKAIDEDKSFLLKTLPTIKDSGLKKMIADYLRKSAQLSSTEKQAIP